MSVTPMQARKARRDRDRAEAEARLLQEAPGSTLSTTIAEGSATTQPWVAGLRHQFDGLELQLIEITVLLTKILASKTDDADDASAQEIAPLHEARGRNNAPAPAQEIAPLHEARGRNNAPALAQEIAPLHEARARSTAPSSAQEIAPLKKTLSLSLLLSLPLNKPHTQNLVGADGSKDADDMMAAVTQEGGTADGTAGGTVQQHKQTVQQQEAKKRQQEKESVAFAEDPKCLVAFWKEEETPDWMRIAMATAAKMAVAKGNNEHQHARKTAVSAQSQRIIARLSVRTTARIIIGNKRFENFYMAAGGPAASER